MALFGNVVPTDFLPGSDFVQIDDEEFSLASEPSGWIAIAMADRQGYISTEAAKRLRAALDFAISNSEAQDQSGEWNIADARDGKYDPPVDWTEDDKIPF